MGAEKLLFTRTNEGEKVDIFYFVGDKPMQASKYISQKGRGKLSHTVH